MSTYFLDGLVVIVVLIFALRGAQHGFLRKMVSLAAWVGAALATLWGFQPLGEWMLMHLSPPWFVYSVSALGIFILSFSAILSAGHALAVVLRVGPVGILDRGAGLLFGMAQGLVLVSLLYLAFVWWANSEQQRPTWLAEARLFPVVESVSLLLWKGALSISSIEELWPELRFDPSLLPGLTPETAPEDALPPDGLPPGSLPPDIPDIHESPVPPPPPAGEET